MRHKLLIDLREMAEIRKGVHDVSHVETVTLAEAEVMMRRAEDDAREECYRTVGAKAPDDDEVVVTIGRDKLRVLVDAACVAHRVYDDTLGDGRLPSSAAKAVRLDQSSLLEVGETLAQAASHVGRRG